MFNAVKIASINSNKGTPKIERACGHVLVDPLVDCFQRTNSVLVMACTSTGLVLPVVCLTSEGGKEDSEPRVPLT